MERGAFTSGGGGRARRHTGSARNPRLAPGGGAGRWAGESGQALVLAVLFVAVVLVFMLAVPGLAVGYAERAAAASAADAAALACASRVTVTQYTDARGNVYQEQIQVDPGAGPAAAAAAWDANLRLWPIRTVSFVATPAGPNCTVRAQVQGTIAILGLIGRRTLSWGVTAEAKAYVGTPGA